MSASNAHLDSDELELYALGRLSPQRVAEAEEHLLLCGVCREALDQAAAVCLALREELSKAAVTREGWLPSLAQWFRQPAFAMAAILALCVISWVGLRNPAPSKALASIQLAAMRGVMPAIPQAGETEILLSDAAEYSGTAQMVDEAGAEVWSGVPVRGKFRITRALRPGSYFIRLFENGRQSREYGFRVR